MNIKYGLTTGSGNDWVELSPHEIIIVSSSNVGNPENIFGFRKIFGEHVHNLVDVMQQIVPGEMILVH